MRLFINILILVVFFFPYYTSAQNDTGRSFKIVPLGVKGGLDESNLSAYMLAASGTDDYVCLDAGTLHAGIQKAIDAGIFAGISVNDVLKRYIKGYCISHAHLDHLAGLIINSTDDTTKNIYAMPYCLDVLKSHYFTWKSWVNFADDGEKPLLNKYHYVSLEEAKETMIPQAKMYLTAFELSHAAPNQSTAFLMRSNNAYLLYLGDTGADSIEKSTKLSSLWGLIAPLIKTKKLKAIFIEVSYTDEQPSSKLFGHLTPSLLMKEMNTLAEFAGNENMRNIPVVITHIKPAGNSETVIKQQLQQLNNLGIKFIFPEQAKLLTF